MKMYEYMVSFRHDNIIGRMEIIKNGPIESYDDVIKLDEFIKNKKGVSELLVTDFKLLRSYEQEENTTEKSKCKTSNDKALAELIDWLKGERYIIRCDSDEMTEKFEKEHQWELSRNRMIDKTIKKIMEL